MREIERILDQLNRAWGGPSWTGVDVGPLLEDLTDAEGAAVGRGAGRLSRARGPLSSLGRRIQAPHDLRAGDSRALTRIYCTS